jgi:C1A family cysteine protease/dipeptidyl aminopeptidase/acylaminoacyl peptidase
MQIKRSLSVFLALILFLLSFGNFVAAGEPNQEILQEAPLNPDYIKFTDDLAKGVVNSNYGYIPPRTDLSHLSSIPLTSDRLFTSLSLPGIWDWRTQGKVTPVKDQGDAGTCWIFGTLASLESRVAIIDNQIYDFSEQNLITTVDPAWVYLIGNRVDGGGNSFKATDTLTKKGTRPESDQPYKTATLNTETCNESTPILQRVNDFRLIANSAGQISEIKNAIYSYGPVSAAYYTNNTWYYPGKIYYYPNCPNPPNHMIAIVGWDDTISHPAGGSTGAWIVKNSWGSSWGNNGYFYLCYGSANLQEVGSYHSNSSVGYEAYNPGERIYYWDEAGMYESIGFPNSPTPTSAWMRNIFIASKSGKLTSVDFWTTSNNAQYQIYVKNSSDTLLGTQSGNCEEMGYYSIPLAPSITLTSGQQFKIDLKMTTPGYNWPMPVETVESNYCEPPIQTGVSFCRYSDTSNWIDLAGSGYNASLRATVQEGVAPAITTISPASGPVTGGTPVTITGTGFVSGATVKIGVNAATDVAFVNTTTITAKTPLSATVGPKDVVVTNPDTQSGTLTNGFTYTNITITSILPNSGPLVGGTPVTITGTGFVSGATVKIGVNAATDVAFVNATTFTAKTPLSAMAGLKDVVITNPDTQSGTLTNGFTYLNPSLFGKIVFTSNREGNYEIYIMNADGSNQTRLTNNTTSDWQPHLSSNGRKIVYLGNGGVYTMNSDGTNNALITSNNTSDPKWSPDGNKIVFSSNRDGNDEIYVMNSDGSNQIRLTNNSATDFSPSWSPDGSKIVFASTRGGSNYQLFIMNSDGTNPTRITNSATWDYQPTWSPDGTKITFTASNWHSGPNWRIYVMNADGSSLRLLTTNTDEEHPSWSPDGTRIAFSSPSLLNAAKIYCINTDGTNQISLTNNNTSEFHPEWGTNLAAVNLSLIPASSTVNVGSTFELTIQADAGAIGVGGVDAFINFDPAKLAVVDRDGGTPGIQITPGTELNTVLTNNANNTLGTIDFAAGKLTGTKPTATFTVAKITFKALAVTAPNTAVSFSTTGSRITKVIDGINDVTGTLTGATVTIIMDAPITFNAVSIIVSGDQTFSLEIKTNTPVTQEVSGVSAFINFDPTKLEVIDDDPVEAGLQITPGASLPMVLLNSANNSAGTIDFNAGKLGSTFPTGAFLVATIHFRAKTVTTLTNTPVTFFFSGLRETAVEFGGTALPGTHTDATVQITAGVNVNISVILQGGSRPESGWVVPLTVKFFTPGVNVMTATPLYTFNLTTAKEGSYAKAQCANVPPGTYDITARSEHTMLNLKKNVAVTAPSTTINLSPETKYALLEGNANNDDRINILDFGILATAYLKSIGDPAYNAMTDFDRNGVINIFDFGLLATNYLKISPIEVP